MKSDVGWLVGMLLAMGVLFASPIHAQCVRDGCLSNPPPDRALRPPRPPNTPTVSHAAACRVTVAVVVPVSGPMVLLNDIMYGSGVLVEKTDSRGLVVTVDYVGDIDWRDITVEFTGGRRFKARLLRTDRTRGLTVLAIALPDVKPAVIARGRPKKGAQVELGGFRRSGYECWRSTVGANPFGEPPPMDRELIDVSGMVLPGCAGGPVFNTVGELVGIIRFGSPTRTLCASGKQVRKVVEMVDGKPK